MLYGLHLIMHCNGTQTSEHDLAAVPKGVLQGNAAEASVWSVQQATD